MNPRKFSIVETIVLILFSLVTFAISYYLFKQGIFYDGKKYYYNWIVIFGASVFGLTGLILFGMPIYSIIINK
jgi:hypothetical protein